MAAMNFVEVDPKTLTSGELVYVTPQLQQEDVEYPTFFGQVSMVDAAAGYVSVMAPGVQTPVAFTIFEWKFSAEEQEGLVPTADGLYVRAEELAAGVSAAQLRIYRLADGEWTVMGEGVCESVPEDLVPLAATPRTPIPAAPTPPPTQSIPVVEETPTSDANPVVDEPTTETPQEEQP